MLVAALRKRRAIIKGVGNVMESSDFQPLRENFLFRPLSLVVSTQRRHSQEDEVSLRCLLFQTTVSPLSQNFTRSGVR